MAEDSKTTAAYGAWKTTETALDMFAEGIPPRIDRSAFPGLAWNAQTRLLVGLRFLGLIDENGVPLPPLTSVAVKDEAARKKAVAEMLRRAYPEVFALDLARVTPAHLAETLGEAYNATGDTRDKAVRFFLAAATYAGIPLSQMLTRDRTRRPGNGRGPKKRFVIAKAKAKPAEMEPPPPPTGGASRTIRLQSGGALTVTATVDFLSLSSDDRQFVFEMIDKLANYEQPQAVDDTDDDEED